MGRIFGRWGMLHEVGQNIIFFIQRGRKGYCDKDLWEINTWFSQTVSRMMKEYSKVNISYPEHSDSICKGYNDMTDEEKYRAWTSLTYHIGKLLGEAKGYVGLLEETEEERKKRIYSKNRAFELIRDNFYDLWW